MRYLVFDKLDFVVYLSVALLIYTPLSYSQVLEEIVVTAQKREQNLQEVPIAVTVLGGEKMRTLQMRDFFDFSKHTPGLMIAGTNKEGKPQIFLRGVGNSDFLIGSMSPIASYADGVYQGANFSLAAALLDLDRVEILKGPQGTLWGRNTTGGLMNYVPVKANPGEALNGYLNAGYAEFDELDVEGAVSLPISNDFGMRIAAKVNTTDGYFDASGGGLEADDYVDGTTYALRGNFVYEPSEALSLGATISYSEKNGSIAGTQHLGTLGAGCTNPGRLGTTCADTSGFVPNSNPHVSSPEVDGFEDVESFGATFTINYDWGDYQLASVTSYNESDHQAFDDTDGAPIQALHGSYDDEYDGWSQELRLSSDYSDRLSWVAGLFYYEDNLDIYAASDLPDLFGFLTFLFGFPITPTRLEQAIETKTAAVFGEVTYQLTDRLEAIGGFRWTYDKRTTTANIAYFTPLNAQFNSKAYSNANTIFPLETGTLKKSSNEPSGRFSLKYALNDDANLWFTFAHGFKGGDPNSGADGAGSAFGISEPEFLTSYEAGLKTQLLDNTLLFDLSGYYYDYTDKQVVTEVTGTGGNNLTILSNAGALTITGIDLAATWSPTERLVIEAGLAWTDAEFDEFLNPGTGVDQAGNTTAYTPEINFNSIIAYGWPLQNNLGTVTIQADFVFTDNHFFTNDNNPTTAQDAYWLVGGNIGYTTADEKWDVRLWVKNLTDEEYLNGGFDFSGVNGGFIQYPAAPRQVGGTVSFRF